MAINSTPKISHNLKIEAPPATTPPVLKKEFGKPVIRDAYASCWHSTDSGLKLHEPPGKPSTSICIGNQRIAPTVLKGDMKKAFDYYQVAQHPLMGPIEFTFNKKTYIGFNTSFSAEAMVVVGDANGRVLVHLSWE